MFHLYLCIFFACRFWDEPYGETSKTVWGLKHHRQVPPNVWISLSYGDPDWPGILPIKISKCKSDDFMDNIPGLSDLDVLEISWKFMIIYVYFRWFSDFDFTFSIFFGEVCDDFARVPGYFLAIIATPKVTSWLHTWHISIFLGTPTTIYYRMGPPQWCERRFINHC